MHAHIAQCAPGRLLLEENDDIGHHLLEEWRQVIKGITDKSFEFAFAKSHKLILISATARDNCYSCYNHEMHSDIGIARSRTSQLAILLGLLLAGMLAAAWPSPVAAHEPIFNDDGSPQTDAPFAIDDPQVSKAISGALREPGALDVYRLDVEAGHTFSFKLMVPDVCPDFAPHLVFMGPGVTDDMSGLPASLELPPDAGAFTVAADTWPTYYESHGRVTYRTGPAFTHTANQDGSFYIAVYDRLDRTGTYLLSMAGSELFAPVPNWRERKAAYDRCALDAGATPTPQPGSPGQPLPVIAFAAVALTAGALVWRRRSLSSGE